MILIDVRQNTNSAFREMNLSPNFQSFHPNNNAYLPCRVVMKIKNKDFVLKKTWIPILIHNKGSTLFFLMIFIIIFKSLGFLMKREMDI